MRRTNAPQPSIELQQTPRMGIFSSRQEYQPVSNDIDEDEQSTTEDDGADVERLPESPFSWLEYAIFLLLGIAMLWAW
jgi:solute carrier family 29 (equilibrative nucleoside transporter), member 1/2/3